MPEIRIPVFKQPRVIDGHYHCPQCGAKLEYNNVTQFYQCLAARDPKLRPHGPTRFSQPICGYDIPLSKVYPQTK